VEVVEENWFHRYDADPAYVTFVLVNAFPAKFTLNKHELSSVSFIGTRIAPEEEVRVCEERSFLSGT
jgi:hypothetical protein